MLHKRVAAVVAALMLLLGMIAFAEEAAAQPPVLVDRINSPQEHADFAFAEDAELLEVIFPQILNTDAAYLRCGGETMLIDCCTDGQAQRIIDMCKQLGITRVDKLVNTHPHADHIGGLRRLLQAIEIGELWICFPKDVNDHMIKAMSLAEQAGVPVYSYADGDVMTLGDATLEVWKLEGPVHQMNDCSAQHFITYGERTLLMAADLEWGGQEKFAELKGERLDADILKYPHHGKDALKKAYLDAVSPLYFVVTNNLKEYDGKKFIRSTGIPYAYTVPGFVHLKTDGQTWLVDRTVSKIKYK